MKISVITATFNSEKSIGLAAASLQIQQYDDVEWIVIDGGSRDGTLGILRELERPPDLLISESDRGIYDALNKGIERASGEVIGLLHSDDFYPDSDVLTNVASAFRDPAVDAAYGDLQYVAERCLPRKDTKDAIDIEQKENLGRECAPNCCEMIDQRFRVVRHWVSGDYDREKFKNGWMPPHPAFYMRRLHYERLGGFNLRYRIAADYESILRYLWEERLQAMYIPKVLMRMRTGGLSNRNLRSICRKSWEDYIAMRRYDLGLTTLLGKNFGKLGQFFERP